MDPPRRLLRLSARALPDGVRLAEARTRRERARGLARLDSPGPGHALLISGCRSVHTFGMRFRLDLLWLDAAGEVIHVARAVPPRRLRWCPRAHSVIEAPAGEGDRLARALDALRRPPCVLSSVAP